MTRAEKRDRGRIWRSDAARSIAQCLAENIERTRPIGAWQFSSVSLE